MKLFGLIFCLTICLTFFQCKNSTEPNEDKKDPGLYITVKGTNGQPLENIGVHIFDDSYLDQGGTLANKMLGNNKISSNDLAQNYPNPFSISTTIRYHIQSLGNLLIQVKNYKNDEVVRTLINSQSEIGDWIVVWDGKNNDGQLVANDVYKYDMIIDDFVDSNYCFKNEMNLEKLNETIPLFKTNKDGLIIINFDDLPIDKIIKVTSEDNPAQLYLLDISDTLNFVFTGNGFQSITKKIYIEKQGSQEMEVVLDSK